MLETIDPVTRPVQQLDQVEVSAEASVPVPVPVSVEASADDLVAAAAAVVTAGAGPIIPRIRMHHSTRNLLANWLQKQPN